MNKTLLAFPVPTQIDMLSGRATNRAVLRVTSFRGSQESVLVFDSRSSSQRRNIDEVSQQDSSGSIMVNQLTVGRQDGEDNRFSDGQVLRSASCTPCWGRWFDFGAKGLE